LLVVVVVLVAVVCVVRSMTFRSPDTARRRHSLGLVATALLIGGAAATAFGFFGYIGESGPELHGGDPSTMNVLGWMLGGGFIAVLVGLLLGLLALIRHAIRQGTSKAP
jgi:protein-S-isoprenylcysteine O-methyltransferase Ste14